MIDPLTVIGILVAASGLALGAVAGAVELSNGKYCNP